MIFPILLCGGSGTRLWPVSRKAHPKQFNSFLGDKTLFEEALFRGIGNGFGNPLVITGEECRFFVSDALQKTKIVPQAIFLEPEGKNTAASVAVAALLLEADAPDALMLVEPSDHHIPDNVAFVKAVQDAASCAKSGGIVTFGIKPQRPETGYGWLELASPADAESMMPVPLVSFKEKPCLTMAEQFLTSQKYVWNAGIFLFSVKTIIKAFEDHAPEVLSSVRKAMQLEKDALGFVRPDKLMWKEIPSISIDYAIMEKADNLNVMPYNGIWSDLGTWESLKKEMDADERGNVCKGDVLVLDCANTLLVNETPGMKIVGIDMKDSIVVAMRDAVLVSSLSSAQKVKDAVAVMESKRDGHALMFPLVHRPWGTYESLAIGECFQVKKIIVKPGASLSLQSHHHRSEHWNFVSGTARVTIDDKVILVTQNQSVYIPVGAKHRLENPSKMPVVLIEVQIGTYLGEDDIVRYKDKYARI